ncbi:MAG: methyltransferase regulatory domain-containing protein [Planctomycetes bacterium]|nr:methyltransferase regulatory domain-containing protein [Planctomycetota bacterium]
MSSQTSTLTAPVPATTYDEIPYISMPYAHSHPERLAAIARLLGLNPPAIHHCRVLELGCASGNNLIPIAAAYPESTFLGLDLSERQIASGKTIINTLGLKNIELRRANIMDFPPTEGKFDYIIVHGIYSWVPAEVQDKILSICKQNLKPDGVAYVSYNVLPGWHMRGMIRDMMLHHIQRFPDPQQKLAQARALLDFLVKAVPADNNPYGLFLKSEMELLKQQSDNYLFHDHLEENNHPIYFHEFVTRAAGKGLRYLGDSDLRTMATRDLHPDAQKLLATSLSQIETEQYMDFLRNRMFRMSLLIHDDKQHNLNIDNQILKDFYVASALRPSAPVGNLNTTDPMEFVTATGDKAGVALPLAKAVLVILAEAWPCRLPFMELLQQAAARLGTPLPNDPAGMKQVIDAVGGPLLLLHTGLPFGVVELALGPLNVAQKSGEKPKASPLARLQAAAGPMCNMRHQYVQLDDFGRQFLLLLDGTQTREQILETLVEKVRRQELVIRENDVVVSDLNRVRAMLQAQLENVLQILANSSLLVP